MTYLPSESEKRTTTLIQALAGVFFFVPPLIILKMTKHRRSPYIRYWSKACLYWSIMSAILVASAVAGTMFFDLSGPAIILLIVHYLFCITGALSSYFNTPFCYWFVARRWCEHELANVYGQLVSHAPRSEPE